MKIISKTFAALAFVASVDAFSRLHPNEGDGDGGRTLVEEDVVKEVAMDEKVEASHGNLRRLWQQEKYWWNNHQASSSGKGTPKQH